MNAVQNSPFGQLVQSRGQVRVQEATPADVSPLADKTASQIPSLVDKARENAPTSPVPSQQTESGAADKANDSPKIRSSKALIDLYA